MSNTDKIAAILGDPQAVNHKLGECLKNNVLVHHLNRVANDQEWDQILTLKSAVILLAARCEDLESDLVKAARLTPIQYIVPASSPLPT